MISYHPRARLTAEQRKEIRENKENLTLKELARKYNVSIPTIRKWKNRENPYDKKHGTKDLYKHHISITPLQEHIICEIRKTTLLPLDDLLDIVTGIGIKITRSALHRALQRNNLSDLRKLISSLDEKSQKEIKEFKKYLPGFIHIDVKVLPKIENERKYLYVAIDRATRVVYVEIRDKKDAKTSSEFLENLIDYLPFKIEKILTDNGGEFTNKSHYKYREQNEKTKQENKENENKKTITPKLHLFDLVCQKYNIEHRLTKPYTPQTNGMVERFNKKVQENVLDMVKFERVEELEQTIYTYVYKYNHFIKHSGIERKTPFEKLKEYYKTNPNIFKKTIDEFIKKDNELFNNNSEGLDNYILLTTRFSFSILHSSIATPSLNPSSHTIHSLYFPSLNISLKI